MKPDTTVERDRATFPRLLPMKLDIHVDVLRESTDWIAQNPGDEVGGKYIGRIHGAFDPDADDWWEQLSRVQLEVVHHLDCGPAAVRTPTFHLPDGPYQESVFRAVESRFPTVRHLGSWHSHHPNGLRTLSRGDIRGYHRDVDSPHHGHDLFLASLATDRRGLAAARHFLFVRGRQEYVEIHPDGVRPVDGQNDYAGIVLEQRERAHSTTGTRRSGPAAAAPLGGFGLLRAVQELWRRLVTELLQAITRLVGEAGLVRQPESKVGSGARAPQLPAWAGTEAGREALARDQAWMKDGFSELELRLRDGVMVWTGVRTYSGVDLAITMAYPDDYPARPPMVHLAGSHGNAEVTVQAVLVPDDDGNYRKNLFLLARRCARALVDMGTAGADGAGR